MSRGFLNTFTFFQDKIRGCFAYLLIYVGKKHPKTGNPTGFGRLSGKQDVPIFLVSMKKKTCFHANQF
jgi:hypothetical protein